MRKHIKMILLLFACPNIAEESVQNALPATGFAQKEGNGVVGEVPWPSSF